MRLFCRIIGLRIHFTGQPPTDPSILISNHISWHDIVVLQSLANTGFVGKHEIKSWPLIGWFAHHGNTLFIRRGKRKSFEQIHAAMNERLSANQSVMFFPEGTTTTGESVKPFRGRLLEPAIKLGLPIQPVAIWYHGKTMQCNELAFVDNEGFAPHAWRTLGEAHIDAYIHFCDAIVAKEGDDWRELSQRAQLIVAEQLQHTKDKANR
jgi:1-acyl-sn-glycerol-3-phosphate acyltransferase